MQNRSKIVLLLSVFTTLPVCAGDHQWGCQFGIINPSGSYLKNDNGISAENKTGIYLGINLSYDVGNVWRLASAINYSKIPDITQSSDLTPSIHVSESRKINSISIDENANFYSGENRLGIFGIVGITAQYWTEKHELTSNNYTVNINDNNLGVGLQVGIGWQFNKHASTTLKYGHVEVLNHGKASLTNNSNAVTSGGNAINVINFGVSWGF